MSEAVTTAVINKRAGGQGLISGRKAFQNRWKMESNYWIPSRMFIFHLKLPLPDLIRIDIPNSIGLIILSLKAITHVLVQTHKRRYHHFHNRKKETPEGLWHKCPSCKHIAPSKEHAQRKYVCEQCGYHDRIGSAEYFEILFDNDQFIELNQI